MDDNSYVTPGQAKDYFDNPPDIHVTQEMKDAAAKVIDKFYGDKFVGERGYLMPDKKQTLREKFIQDVGYPVRPENIRHYGDLTDWLNNAFGCIIDQLDREAVRVERITPQPAPLTPEEQASLEEDEDSPPK